MTYGDEYFRGEIRGLMEYIHGSIRGLRESTSILYRQSPQSSTSRFPPETLFGEPVYMRLPLRDLTSGVLSLSYSAILGHHLSPGTAIECAIVLLNTDSSALSRYVEIAEFERSAPLEIAEIIKGGRLYSPSRVEKFLGEDVELDWELIKEARDIVDGKEVLRGFMEPYLLGIRTLSKVKGVIRFLGREKEMNLGTRSLIERNSGRHYSPSISSVGDFERVDTQIDGLISTNLAVYRDLSGSLERGLNGLGRFFSETERRIIESGLVRFDYGLEEVKRIIESELKDQGGLDLYESYDRY